MLFPIEKTCNPVLVCILKPLNGRQILLHFTNITHFPCAIASFICCNSNMPVLFFRWLEPLVTRYIILEENWMKKGEKWGQMSSKKGFWKRLRDKTLMRRDYLGAKTVNLFVQMDLTERCGTRRNYSSLKSEETFAFICCCPNIKQQKSQHGDVQRWLDQRVLPNARSCNRQKPHNRSERTWLWQPALVTVTFLWTSHHGQGIWNEPVAYPNIWSGDHISICIYFHKSTGFELFPCLF